jgi:hypothetical protein
MRINTRAFALAVALVWGVGLFVLTWWVIAFEGSTGRPTVIGHVYRGYRISPLGSVIGFAWAFVDGLVGGAVFAWLYNRLDSLFHSGGAQNLTTEMP